MFLAMIAVIIIPHYGRNFKKNESLYIKSNLSTFSIKTIDNQCEKCYNYNSKSNDRQIQGVGEKLHSERFAL